MWFYAKDGEQHGPVEAEDIRDRLESGDLSNGTLVWREGMAQWTPLGEVLELREPVPASAEIKKEGGESPEREGTPANAVPSTSEPYVAPAVTQLPQPAPQLVAPIQQNSMALVSLILGIISLVLCMGPLTAIPAIICGHIARKQFRELPTPQSGEGMAMAGLIMGYIVTVLSIAVFVFYIVFFVVAINSASVTPLPSAPSAPTLAP